MYSIPCMYFRGGTSKGPCFLREDLPQDSGKRDEVLLNLMGSPDPSERQIDGIGGGDSLSSKVVIVGKSNRQNVDVDFLLCQVHIKNPIVETTLNCGNMLSAVAPFAIERGLVRATHPETVVKIYNENTGVIMESTVQTPNGKISYNGETHIDGVPGCGAPIKLTFLNAVGSKTGKLLPTGNVIDDINGVFVSCVDVAVPMVITDAKYLGKTGYESKKELDGDKEFMSHLEMLRQAAAKKMGLGDVSKSVNPKICMLSSPRNGGTITSRYFTPFDCHDAHAVSAGLCLAAAILIPGTLASQIADKIILEKWGAEKEIIIEHVSGVIATTVTVEITPNGIAFPKASFIRTARPLFDGNVYVTGERPQLVPQMTFTLR